MVTLTLAGVEAGTRLRMVHSGFVLPRNTTAFTRHGPGLEDGGAADRRGHRRAELTRAGLWEINSIAG